MKTKYKGWVISRGKGDRHYIEYNGTDENCEGMMHGDLSSMNGAGFYGYHHLQNLAIAIIKFEESNFIDGSITGQLGRN